MKRVASLYLPDWPIERIERLAQAERPKSLHSVTPPDAGARRDSDAIARHAEDGRQREAPSDAGFACGAAVEAPDSFESLSTIAAQEQAVACSVPRGGGWRPGARWARQDDDAARWARQDDDAARWARQEEARQSRVERDAQIAALPAHQRPPLRELGRRSEAAGHPFKTMRPDEGGAPVRDARVVAFNRHAGLVPATTPPHAPQQVVHGGPQNKPVPSFVEGAGVTERKNRVRPLVTSIQDGNKLVIAAASPAARALGVVPGMAVTQARAQLPELDIRPADPAGDRAALQNLAISAARRWCPIVALSDGSQDDSGLFLDITGTAHLFGGEERMARRIVRLLARVGHRARVAVADTPGAAWALARFAPPSPRPDAQGILLCPPNAQIETLAQLPIAALRLDARAIELLKRLGVESVGQLAALPRAPLARRFGGSLMARLDQASGLLPEPLDPVIPPDPIAVFQRFAEPIATAEAIAHWLGVLMSRLVTALGEAGLGARAIELVADRIDGVPQRLRIGLARPTRDAAHLLRLTTRRIEEIAPGYGIDALALHVRRADPLGAEPFVERLDEDTAPDLAPLVDTLAVRIGPERLWRTRPVESDVPERSVAPAPVLDPSERTAPLLKPSDVRLLDRTAALHPWQHRWPRPVRLLRRPERLDHVVAELPDQPPRRFAWRGTMHRVVRADGPERILGEWWKRPSERHSVRDYFRVEDEAGQRFWVFRRGDGERSATGDLAWFMHGSFG